MLYPTELRVQDLIERSAPSVGPFPSESEPTPIIQANLGKRQIRRSIPENDDESRNCWAPNVGKSTLFNALTTRARWLLTIHSRRSIPMSASSHPRSLGSTSSKNTSRPRRSSPPFSNSSISPGSSRAHQLARARATHSSGISKMSMRSSRSSAASNQPPRRRTSPMSKAPWIPSVISEIIELELILADIQKLENAASKPGATPKAASATRSHA